MVITGNESHLRVKIQFNLEAWIDSCGGFFSFFFALESFTVYFIKVYMLTYG